ncbi:hypothetical protein H2200_003427 [Cladophialophora chaetospira]|uniref:F-box domain-containing protein n=1 Tax=Cladophialophora chaetospira TaxID=386627 RepID=A0AA38XHC6_9EURO|nr:hypothetical protein H2200_003427 [Cladophialophora chaetospira]
MPRTINDFPVELLRLVLRQIKLDSLVDRGTTLVKTFGVCRLWYKIAVPYLYADLSFRRQQLRRFLATTHSHMHLVRSLTLDVSNLDPVTGRNPQSILLVLESVSALLGQMENFECFSVSDRYMVGAWHTEESNSVMRNMMDQLPSSVRHLELDLGIALWFNTCELEDSPHVCPALRPKINSLHNLRLRLPTLCNDLFRPGLEETDANIRPGSDVAAVGRTVIINTFGDTAKDPGDDPSEAPEAVDSAAAEVASWASSAVSRGTIQDIGRLSIMSFEDRDVVWPRWIEGEYVFQTDTRFSAVNDRRVTGKPRLLKFPTRHLRQSYHSTFIRCRDSNGEEKDVIGSWRNIRQLVEGPVWVETKGRCRIPRTYFDSNARFEGVLLKKLDFMNDEKTKTLSRWFLTAKERRHGRLLHTQDFEDFEDAGPMMRDLTPGERKAMLVLEGEESDHDFEYSSGESGKEEVEWSRSLKKWD